MQLLSDWCGECFVLSQYDTPILVWGEKTSSGSFEKAPDHELHFQPAAKAEPVGRRAVESNGRIVFCMWVINKSSEEGDTRRGIKSRQHTNPRTGKWFLKVPKENIENAQSKMAM